MKTIKVNYDTIHTIVDGKVAYWDGWTAIFIKPNHNAYTQKRAVFRNNEWNTVRFISEPNEEGLWEVPYNV